MKRTEYFLLQFDQQYELYCVYVHHIKLSNLCSAVHGTYNKSTYYLRCEYAYRLSIAIWL